MEDLKTKEEILSEYFLVETEKTDKMKGWKVVGTIEGCAGQSVSPLLELKTDGDGWLCDFKIKLLHCGLVLASPEYVIEEDELVMEAMEKVWNVCGVAQQLQEVLQKELDKSTITTPYPYYPNDSWSTTDDGTWTKTTIPTWWTNTISCTDAAYIPTLDSIGTTSTATSYSSAATCSCTY